VHAQTLDGRVALVSGATASMAAQFARDVTDRGGRVAVAGKSSVELDGTIGALGPARALLVGDPPADEATARALVASVHEALGPVTIVVHAAAPTAAGPVAELSIDDWQRGTADVLDTAFLLVQATAPAMVEASFGRHVLLGSSSAHTGRPERAVLAATTTAGLDGLARTIAQELGRQGVTANVVLAGPADGTPTAIGRPVDEAEVSSMCMQLCSDAGAAVTGARVLVDGGVQGR